MIMLIIIAILSGILFMILDDKDEAAIRRQIRQQEKSFKRRQKEIALIEKAQKEAGDQAVVEKTAAKEVDTDAEE